MYTSVKHTYIASDNGLSPIRRKPLSEPMLLYCQLNPKEHFSVILFEIRKFSFKKMHLKMSFAKWRPFCLGLNVLNSIHD